MQGQSDAFMSAELRQVANGYAYRVKSFGACDVNRYRFHTTRHEQSRQIEEPRIPDYLRQETMGSSTMEELKKYTNSCFMVPNLSYSNVIGSILKLWDGPRTLG